MRSRQPTSTRGLYGRIVNVASVAGKEGNPNASASSASKSALIALTKTLGKETATTGIRVNCITPAVIKTPLFDEMTPQHIGFMLSKIPLGRFGAIEEATSLACWLASEECSFRGYSRINSGFFGRIHGLLRAAVFDNLLPDRRRDKRVARECLRPGLDRFKRWRAREHT